MQAVAMRGAQAVMVVDAASVAVGGDGTGGVGRRFVVVVDPLDAAGAGGGDVDWAIASGSVFGIYEALLPRVPSAAAAFDAGLCAATGPDGAPASGTAAGRLTVTTGAPAPRVQAPALDDLLQPGAQLAAAGYCMYSSTSFLAVALGARAGAARAGAAAGGPSKRGGEGDGEGGGGGLAPGASVDGFSLDRVAARFVLSHPALRVPARGKVYSFDEGTRPLSVG